ncbi:TonB-dependent receptor [Pedobacter sp. BS3]|uniref:TonB-dependent receptor n=1 Tax=Pedobacter sp. BS3 TaxID=2567937 RepID=UPI0011EFD891|nr:TonB-dependent receptor [Pedobacter sp. BS3]TZF83179.1 TonB-dependent receptor [Pedobacter sp. BS3]
MKLRFMLLFMAALQIHTVSGQHLFKAFVKDSKTREPLVGVTAILTGTTKGSSTDTNGLVTLANIPGGKQVIEFRYVGYETRKDTFLFPLANAIPVEILLTPQAGELDEIVISSTRSSRTIKDIPTRVEFIAGEELEEKANMKAGDIRMLLSESTGIQTQQTSATSANASIRIQGLDGRYTQILKDGFPLYAGAASGLGLLQTPPLDLKQVEVIKGSASTLYGGGAIAGLVNLISKTPGPERELSFHLNGSSGKGFDLNGFYSQKFNKTGTTIFASHSRNWAYDPANIDLTAIPRFERYVFNPKIFVYFSDKTKLNFGVNTTVENRIGGDIHYIQGQGDATHSYFEKNQTQRYSTQLAADHILNNSNAFHFKNSVSYFNRKISIPGYQFNGTQTATFSEASYVTSKEQSEWIMGVNLWTDDFREARLSTFPLRNYSQLIFGAFVQNTWKTTPWLNLETGFRTDYVMDYGFALLPRVSALFKISDKFSSRLGGGFGYKTPTIFTEESERIQYRDVLPIDKNRNKLERSYGGNIDFNYRTVFGEKLTFSINQLFFYTRLDNPLLLNAQPNGWYQFINTGGHIDTRGTETNAKFGYEDFKLFLGYTFTDARLHQNDLMTTAPLTPKHRINSVLMYEVEDKWKAGLEAYFFSRQHLTDGTTGRSYVLCGFMLEKLWDKFSVYINFENFLDARQTRFDSIYRGTITHPVFRDIYAPLDGFLINGGIKLKL